MYTTVAQGYAASIKKNIIYTDKGVYDCFQYP